MKNKIIIFIVAILVASIPARAVNAYDINIMMRGPDNDATFANWCGFSGDGVLAFDHTNLHPIALILGSDLSISSSTLVINSSIARTASLATVATSGSYNDLTNKPSARSFNNSASKTLVTSAAGQGGVVLDASRDVSANYSISTSTTATIGGASTVTVYLEIASTNSATAGDWTTIAKESNGQTITLAVALQSVQTNILNFGAIVPAGQYSRIRYSTTGTASCSYDSGQEVKL